MKADPAAQQTLLDLQDLDTRLDQLAHRRARVPQIAELATLDGRAAVLRDRQVAADTAVSDLTGEQAKAEADVEQARKRLDRDRALLASGSVASARQLEDLEREVESLLRRISDLEDVELEFMERLEQAQRVSEQVRVQAEELVGSRAATLEQRDHEFADVDAEVARVQRERTRVVAAVPVDLLKLYERIRADQGGIAAAPLRLGRCQGCRLQLTPSDLGRIADSPADEVIRCEECRRILVRTPESGL